MTKAGEKLIAAAREAVVVARCEHDLEELPKKPGRWPQWTCKKCQAHFTRVETTPSH